MDPLAAPEELVELMQDDTVPEATALLNVTLASGAVRAWCGWPLSYGTRSQRFRLAQNEALWLPTMRLLSIDSLSLDGAAVLPSAFVWDEDGRVELTGAWWGSRRATVAWTEGYEEGDSELDAIKGVVLSAAARLTENPTAERSYTIGAEAVVAAGAGADVISLLAAGERLQLEPYRLVALA